MNQVMLINSNLIDSQIVFYDENNSNCLMNESKTNLIVNYLPQTFSYDELKSLFGRFGKLESCKLVFDKMTGQSLCYGFVNFVNIEDADRAHRELNGVKLQNKQIKVSFARPSSESIKGANLYVSGLPKSWTTNEFNLYFSQCGQIITSRILNNPENNQSKGVGFIRYDQRYEAEYAIQKLNGIIPPILTPADQLDPNQEALVVKFANFSDAILSNNKTISIPITTTSSNLINNCNTNVFYSNPPLVYSNQFRSIPTAYNYPRYPPIITTQDYQSNQIAFYSTPSPSANKPVADSTATYLPPTGWCIFVYNLAPETEENILWQLFGPFGAVQNIKLIRDYQNKKCKGFGFVTMTNYEEALVAINALNGFTLGNRQLQVSFKKNPQNYIF
jgi:ELAV like protein 2/3/4